MKPSNGTGPLRVGFDARPIFFTRGGVAHYVVGLLNALTGLPDEVALTPFCPRPLTKELGYDFHPALTPRILRFPLRWKWSESLWENLLLSRAARRSDVVHFPRFALPRNKPNRSVVTVHDLAFRLHPETLTDTARHYFEAATSDAVHRADAIIAVSQNTRDDLLNAYAISSDRVHVVHNGIDARFFEIPSQTEIANTLAHYHLSDGYILCVGTLEPRKNLSGAINAYAELLHQCRETIHLVLVGGKGWLYENILETIKEKRLSDTIRLLGHVPERHLPILYHGARAFFFPSFYEGFGIPILEAMACGTPVVASNTSCLPEIAGDAALLTSPSEPEEMACALMRVLEDPILAEKLRTRGRRRAANFTWENAAKKTVAVYRYCLAD